MKGEKVMALVKCPDCNHDVSNIAPTCPSCGRPMATTVIEATSKPLKSQAAGGCLMAIIGLVVAFTVGSTSGNGSWHTIGLIIAIVGMLIYLNARVNTWWHHG